MISIWGITLGDRKSGVQRFGLNCYAKQYKHSFKKFDGPEKGRLNTDTLVLTSLFAAGVLCYSFGAFADSVLGQFTGQEETYSGLDLPTCDGGSLVVVGKT